MQGKLIVLEGTDGSGKATQAALLTEKLKQAGKKVRKVSFPNYDSPSSALVKMYLDGAFGQKPDDVNAYAASCFYAVDRFASFRADWGQFYAEGGIIVADRYTTSNAVHQCVKLPQAEWERYLGWLFTFEYEQLGIPAPDLVCYLRVDPALSQDLMRKRYAGDESRKDIHEKDSGYLIRAREAADHCAERLGWQVIECTEQGAMKPIETVHALVWEQVQKLGI
ncbi:MAG TPA: thymidylate kinase [Ruminococcus sp.]|nr:thymidylate kinase [Ruminococcus sp.]